jgi:ribonuclease Z
MIPRQAPRDGQIGFLYFPPIRVQGISIAGEQTAISIPEYDIAFDIGLCPRPVLTAPIVALSHTHMDHIAGLPYYFSQRFFQKMVTGTCYCPFEMADPIRAMMRSWNALERQETPQQIVGLAPGDEVEIKPGIWLRAHASSHTIPSLGYALIEKRKKLRSDLLGISQDEIRERRRRGEEITQTVEVPLVAYSGDTEPAPFLFHNDFTKARIVICECTFYDLEHRDRAKVGKHLHVEDLRPLLSAWTAEHVVVVHASRRTLLSFARERLAAVAGDRPEDSVHLLMDFKANRKRLEQQSLQFDPVVVEGGDTETTESSDAG